VDDDKVQDEVMKWFKGLAADFYDSGIQKLVPRLNKCLDNAGDYVEKQSYVHLQCRFCKLKMLYMFKTFPDRPRTSYVSVRCSSSIFCHL